MYTTTQNLLLTRAVDHFGIENESKIKIYMLARCIAINLTNWKDHYHSLVKDAHEHGYSSVVDFCKDVRYSTMLQQLDDKTRLYYDILEGRVDPDVYLCAADSKPNYIQEQVVTEEEIKKYYAENVGQETVCEEVYVCSEAIYKQTETVSRVEYQPSKQVAVDPREFKEEIESKIEVEDVNVKAKKRYYYRMNEEEKDFDDYIDKVADYFSTNSDHLESGSSNEALDNFPVYGKVKNKEEREEIEFKEYVKRQEAMTHDLEGRREAGRRTAGKRKEDEAHIRKIKRILTIEDHYKNISEKILGRRRGEKDKNAWSDELKIIIRAIQLKTERRDNKETKNLSSALKMIFDELKKENQMANEIFRILLAIQETFFKSNDSEILGLLYDFKKLICAFFDFYRK